MFLTCECWGYHDHALNIFIFGFLKIPANIDTVLTRPVSLQERHWDAFWAKTFKQKPFIKSNNVSSNKIF